MESWAAPCFPFPSCGCIIGLLTLLLLLEGNDDTITFFQAHLIEGIIDQVDGTVHVSWVQPRVLGIDQVKSLRDRLDTWVGKVHTTLLSVEAETPDLISSWRSSVSTLKDGCDLTQIKRRRNLNFHRFFGCKSPCNDHCDLLAQSTVVSWNTLILSSKLHFEDEIIPFRCKIGKTRKIHWSSASLYEE